MNTKKIKSNKRRINIKLKDLMVTISKFVRQNGYEISKTMRMTDKEFEKLIGEYNKRK